MAGYFSDRIRRRNERVVLQGLLRELRVERGWSQQQLADALGVPQPIVSNIETGERRVDLLELRQICVLLEVSLTTFLEKLEVRLHDDVSGNSPP